MASCSRKDARSHCHLDTEGLKQPCLWHRLSLSPVTTGRLALSSCLSLLMLLLINQWFSNKEQAYLRVLAGLRGSSPAAIRLPWPPRSRHPSTADSSAAPGPAPGPWPGGRGTRRAPGGGSCLRPQPRGSAEPPGQATVSLISTALKSD